MGTDCTGTLVLHSLPLNCGEGSSAAVGTRLWHHSSPKLGQGPDQHTHVEVGRGQESIPRLP